MREVARLAVLALPFLEGETHARGLGFPIPFPTFALRGARHARAETAEVTMLPADVACAAAALGLCAVAADMPDPTTLEAPRLPRVFRHFGRSERALLGHMAVSTASVASSPPGRLRAVRTPMPSLAAVEALAQSSRLFAAGLRRCRTAQRSAFTRLDVFPAQLVLQSIRGLKILGSLSRHPCVELRFRLRVMHGRCGRLLLPRG
mmetsp:Transcript_1006/g.2182  ORF Transcript_1006/g.2182 Transcript_1006/m.2182 type:complete len:205 (+) Transcript_1006:251-865(+)